MSEINDAKKMVDPGPLTSADLVKGGVIFAHVVEQVSACWAAALRTDHPKCCARGELKKPGFEGRAVRKLKLFRNTDYELASRRVPSLFRCRSGAQEACLGNTP